MFTKTANTSTINNDEHIHLRQRKKFEDNITQLLKGFILYLKM